MSADAAPAPRARSCGAWVLTSTLAVASVLLVAGAAGYAVDPEATRLAGRRVLGLLGHAESARVVALTLQEPERAAWLRRAAERGDVPACVILGDSLMDAWAVRPAERPELLPEARALYRTAAEVGDVVAAARLGTALVFSARELRAEGVEWLRQAAQRAEEVRSFARLAPRTEHGSVLPWDVAVDPMTALGEVTRYGFGAEKDPVTAAGWYRRAQAWRGACCGPNATRSHFMCARGRLAELLAHWPDLRQPGDPPPAW